MPERIKLQLSLVYLYYIRIEQKKNNNNLEYP